MSIIEELSEIFSTAFVESGLPAELGTVRVSDRTEMAEFQCNGAMPAAKKLGKNPREIAQDIINHVKTNPAFKELTLGGPGFINIFLSDNFLKQHVQKIEIPKFSEGETVILDYGGPNIAKPMHVGHLRTGIIGDTLRRILKAVGFNTLGDVHMGDWGTHMGMLMMDYIRNNEEDLVRNCDLENADEVQRLFDDMAERYPKASSAAKESEALMNEAREATVKLQNKEEPFFTMFQKIRDVSIRAMEHNYGLLNVHFDLWKGEADVHDLIAPMFEKLKDKKYAVLDDGAWIIPVERNNDKKKYPPLILYKSDGGVMYGTTDMATVVERINLYQPARILYMVDQRQSLHFEQLFRAVRLSNIVSEEVELTFAGVGTMNGTDGKPFKTRAGGVMRLSDMIEMAQNKAMERLDEANLAQDMSFEERKNVALNVGIAALKFADLQNQRHADYVFDLERMTNFEGKTGPYLLYQAVRIKSLLRKANDQGVEIPNNVALIIEDTERPLSLLLTQLPEVLKLTVRNYAPHVLCDYTYNLAQTFSSFYGNCHILSEENQDIKISRLQLCQLTLNRLEQTLNMLGIDIPERM